MRILLNFIFSLNLFYLKLSVTDVRYSIIILESEFMCVCLYMNMRMNLLLVQVKADFLSIKTI
jgi:hypothetical protein